MTAIVRKASSSWPFPIADHFRRIAVPKPGSKGSTREDQVADHAEQALATKQKKLDSQVPFAMDLASKGNKPR